MKMLIKTLITLSTLGLALATPIARAQDGAAKPEKQHPQNMGERFSPAERVERLTKLLDLTDAQKTSILAIIQDSAAAGKALWDDKSLSKEDRRAKMMEVRKAEREKIAAQLTPAQIEKFKEERKGHGGPGGPGGPGGLEKK